MKCSLVSALTLASTSYALVARDSSCCFGLSGSGGTVGQLSDGQNRIGGGLPAGTYCLSNGQITDGNGRGCILTPPTTQFQCDTGATPTGGFAIDCNGDLTYNGSDTFYECPTGDNGEYNIYTTPPSGQGGCFTTTLAASACKPDCQKTCPTNLSGSYQFPHLIIPVDSTNPNTAAGTSYDGTITPTISSYFLFDIPSSYNGLTCSLIFLFPEQSQLQTSSYTFSGSGEIDFSFSNGNVNNDTDYANAPGVETDYGVTTVAPGNSYLISTFACPANTAITFELKSEDGTSLTYFQDYNPSPIGLYITSC